MSETPNIDALSIDDIKVVAGADKVLEAALMRKYRNRVRSSLDAWSIHCGNAPARHHRFINSLLEKVESGSIKKLAITLPPGAAKSTYANVQFVPHFIAQRRGLAVLSASHSAELAASFGRRERELINTHSVALGYKLKKQSQAADRWETDNGGGFLAAGAGAGIAGFRADLGIIDDPIGKKEDADSKVMRDKIWNWYLYDFTPRLKPSASQVLIQTRWHEDDLMGRILKLEPERWHVVNIPLVAGNDDALGRAPGELLWPEWFNQSTLDDAMKDQEVFNCLYQNNPIPSKGNYFENEWIQGYAPADLPKDLRYYVASDHAVSKRQEADSSVILPIGLDCNDNIYILPDFIWEKMTPDVAVDKMLAVARRYKPIAWWAGKEHITQSIGPFLNKRMVETNNYIPLIETTSKRDLSTRAQAIRARMRTGKVFFPFFSPKWGEMKHQLLSFPKGTHDDVIAALSELGMGLDSMFSPQRPVVTPVETINSEWRPTMKWIRQSEKTKSRAERMAALDR